MEMLSGNAASDYDMLRAYGCLAYYHVSDGKLEPQERKARVLRVQERSERLNALEL